MKLIKVKKGYYIPVYLIKRKIEQIRQKIIARKYGYLLYRKTVSHILPSQACKLFERKLKKKYFERWLSFWYEETISWKLNIRAEIHYNLTIIQNVIRRWKCFHVKQKAAHIKEKIALMHYDKVFEEYTLKAALNKWKFYIQCKRYRRWQMGIAWKHYKKNNPDVLQAYLYAWINYTNLSRKKKFRFDMAINHYNIQLKDRSLKMIISYKNARKVKQQLRMKLQIIFDCNMKKHVITIWRRFKDDSIEDRQNLILAVAHYHYRLKVIAFSKLWKNKIRSTTMKQILTLSRINHCQRTLATHLKQWKMYCLEKKNKRYKELQAILLHTNSLLRHNFMMLWRYTLYRQNKKENRILIINNFRQKMNENILRKAIGKLKRFKMHKRKREGLKIMANMYSNRRILKSSLNAWKMYIRYKRYRELQNVNSTKFYQKTILILSLRLWKLFVMNEKQFRVVLLKAKDYYKFDLINESLNLIIKAGFIKRDHNFNQQKERMCSKLFLMLKYFGIWKRKVLYSKKENIRCPLRNMTNVENISLNSNFEWFPIFFLSPRIPERTPTYKF